MPQHRKMKHKIKKMRKHRKIKYKKEKKKNHIQVGILIVMAVIFLIAVGFAYLSFIGLPEKPIEKAGGGNIIMPNCVDSDGGRIYSIKGTTSMRNGLLVYTDSCHEVPGNQENPDVSITSAAILNSINNGGDITLYYWLKEYYCSGDSVQSEYFRCPNGCIEGACSGYEDCTDSDGGINVYEKGTVTFHEQSQSDYCDYEPQHTGFNQTIEVPVYNLTEMYCENNMMQYVYLTCPEGKECKEGRCVNETISEPLKADPSSIVVLVGYNATSIISGGTLPYLLSKMPNSSIANVWLSETASINRYILTVYGKSVGLTDVAITDSSPEDSMINIPITVTLPICSKTGSVCTDMYGTHYDYCSSYTVLNNYTCVANSISNICAMHQDDCRALRGSTGYCDSVTKTCKNNVSQVGPDLIVYSIERIGYSTGDGLRIVVKNIGGNYGVNSTLLVNITSAGMSIYGLMILCLLFLEGIML